MKRLIYKLSKWGENTEIKEKNILLFVIFVLVALCLLLALDQTENEARYQAAVKKVWENCKGREEWTVIIEPTTPNETRRYYEYTTKN